MTTRRSLPKIDQWRLLYVGLGIAVVSFFLECILNASVKYEGIHLRGFFEDSAAFPFRFAFLCLLLLLIVYVANVVKRHRSLEDVLLKYQIGMDASADGIAILDQNYRCVYLNSSYTWLFGYDSHTDLLGTSWRLHFSTDEVERLEKEISPVILTTGKWRGEAIGRKRNGTMFPLEISVTRMGDKALVCIARDISARKRSEAELERQARELLANNRELQAFSYSLSHDMRNYVSHSSMAVQILWAHHSVALDEEGRDLLGVISKANDDMTELIQAMLELSQVSRNELRWGEVNLSELVRSIVAGLVQSEPERKVEVCIADDLFCTGDANLLKVALENLIQNAWKYSSKAHNPRIEFGSVESNDGRAFFVHDNGIGFDMTEAHQMFEPFRRLSNARQFSGTGIGLATVQRIMQRLGWEVWSEGEAGKGATFYLCPRPPELS